jgi:N6-L-threonylcarbamoyladenine synthase
VDVLRIKLRRAAALTGAKSLIVGGGVVANTALREACGELARKLRCTLRLPALEYCGDNAAMVAGLGWHLLRAGRTAGLDLEAYATVKR